MKFFLLDNTLPAHSAGASHCKFRCCMFISYHMPESLGFKGRGWEEVQILGMTLDCFSGLMKIQIKRVGFSKCYFPSPHTHTQMYTGMYHILIFQLLIFFYISSSFNLLNIYYVPLLEVTCNCQDRLFPSMYLLQKY